MSLHTIITSLETDWTRRARRNRPQDRWAATHPALGVDLPELRQQLADGRTDTARSRFAELVDLARHGDQDAALLVTLSVLADMERYEHRCISRNGAARASNRIHDYDTLAGAVWEALIASRSYKPAHLREDIIRQAWLITRRRTLSPSVEIPDQTIGTDPSFTTQPDDAKKPLTRSAQMHTRHRLTVPSHDETVASRIAIDATLARLTACGKLTDRGRAVLESIADDRTGGHYSRGHSRAFAQYRLRLVRPLRTSTELLDALTA